MDITAAALEFFLPYQVRWINDPSPVSIGEKSRRIGWTYASSYRAVDRRVRLGTNLYFSSADLTTAREFVDDCRKWAEFTNFAARQTVEEDVIDDEKITTFVLTFTNGARIVAGSSNPKFFRGKGGDADGDEFAFHARPRELIKAMQPAALFAGHQLRLWSTHNGEGNYFNQLLRQARAGEIKASVHRVTILDAVEQGIVEKVLGLKGPDEKARREWLDTIRSTVPDEDVWNEEYMCRPSSEQSSLLSYELIRGCEAGNLRLAPTVEAVGGVGSGGASGGMLYAGYDVGRKHDRSVLWVNEKVGDVYWTRMMLVIAGESYTAQEQRLNLLMQNRAVRRVCVDSTGIGAMLAERLVQRWGYRAEAVTFTAAAKSELAMPLLRLFQDKRVRVPAEPDVREDLHAVRKVVTAANNIRLDADRDERGHADRFWALALASHAAEDFKRPLPASIARKPLGW
jgi:phage FluMu gp28-like protein